MVDRASTSSAKNRECEGRRPPNLVERQLFRLTVCPCGDSALRDGIPLGTIYQIDLDSINTGFAYRCGKCGVTRRVTCVLASSTLAPESPLAWLPLALFDAALPPQAD
jgi:hypothetical protein